MISISRKLSNVVSRIVISAHKTTTAPNIAYFSTSPQKCQAENPETEHIEKSDHTAAELKRLQNDRTKVIPIETALKYLKSSAYQQTYGEQLVWEQYRRNHKGLIPPKKTRKTCVRQGALATGNPCPICRDEYLVLDYRNVELLKQFISPHSGKILSYTKTGLCQKKHEALMVAVEKAKDCGYLEYDVPFRDYSKYYQEYQDSLNKTNTSNDKE